MVKTLAHGKPALDMATCKPHVCRGEHQMAMKRCDDAHQYAGNQAKRNPAVDGVIQTGTVIVCGDNTGWRAECSGSRRPNDQVK